MADDIEAPFTIATGSTLFALLFLVLLLRASACACGGVSKRERERERSGYYSSRDIKRDTSHKNQSAKCLEYQKEDKEEDEDEDFDKSSTLRSSKMHKRE